MLRQIHMDLGAPHCSDQVPLISQIGRGLRGNSFTIVKQMNENGQEVLVGKSYDEATKEETVEWTTQPLGMGELTCSYESEVADGSKYMTIVFTYKKDDNVIWTFETPRIPYIGEIEREETTIELKKNSTLFLKKVGETWQTEGLPTPHSKEDTKDSQEKLIYPAGTTRDDFTAPVPGEPGSICLTYGKGGDIDCPTTAEVAETIDGLAGYIEQELGKAADLATEAAHQLCVNDSGFVGTLPSQQTDGGLGVTIKQYIDSAVRRLENSIQILQTRAANCKELWKRTGFYNEQNDNIDDTFLPNGMTIKEYIDNKLNESTIHSQWELLAHGGWYGASSGSWWCHKALKDLKFGVVLVFSDSSVNDVMYDRNYMYFFVPACHATNHNGQMVKFSTRVGNNIVQKEFRLNDETRIVSGESVTQLHITGSSNNGSSSISLREVWGM